MVTDFRTPPISIGKFIIGDTESSFPPFEPASVDYTILSKRKSTDPTYGQDCVTNAIVNSCSQCCMDTINGKPNLLGKMHRKMVKSCSQCPVGMAGDYIQARDGKGNKIFLIDTNGVRRPMTQTELMLMETDGTA